MNFAIQMDVRLASRDSRIAILKYQCHLNLYNVYVYLNYSISMYANTPGRTLQKWGTRLPHPFSHPCPRLTANGLSKWPIAESLCNCVIRFHTFQSSNPIRMCLCALRFFFPFCVHYCMCTPKIKTKQSKNRFMHFMSLHVRASRVDMVLNEMWSYSPSVELDVHVSEDSHVCLLRQTCRGWWCQLVAVKARGAVFCLI